MRSKSVVLDFISIQSSTQTIV